MIVTFKGKDYSQHHGSPFDRGAADSYYGRSPSPHYWPEGTYRGTMVSRPEMTPAEVEAYYAGYSFNEELGSKKDWGMEPLYPDNSHDEDNSDAQLA